MVVNLIARVCNLDDDRRLMMAKLILKNESSKKKKKAETLDPDRERSKFVLL